MVNNNILHPDQDEARRFLSLAFGDRGELCFQIFGENGASIPPQWKYGSFEALSPWLVEQNQAGAGIFVMINPGDGKGRKNENVMDVSHLFVDLDGAPLDPLLNCGAPPHIITESSPNRYQAFWHVIDCSRKQFTPYQRALARKYQGDPAVCDLCRVMRVPGFFHQKKSPFLSRIQKVSRLKPWTVSVLRKLLCLEFNGDSHIVKTSLQASASEIFCEGQRHRRMLTVMARLRNAGLIGEALFRAAMDANNDRCAPPLPEGEIRRMAAGYSKKNEMAFVERTRPVLNPTSSIAEAIPPPTDLDFQPSKATQKTETERKHPTIAIRSYEEIFNEPLEDIKWIIDDFLPVGLTILAADPKSGKSWLAQHLTIAVASGGMALDHYHCNQAAVLSLSLEDSTQRFKHRLHKLLDGQTPPPNAHFARKWELLPQGMRHIVDWIRWHENPGLVVIDTFQRIRGRTKSYGQDGIYERDYRDVACLQEIAQDHQIAIILVHHLNKGNMDDSYQRISGSQGLTGASDQNYVMVTDREKNEAILTMTGRELDDRRIWIQQDQQTGRWFYQGTAAEKKENEMEGSVIEALADLGRPSSPTEIARYLGKSRQTVHKQIKAILGKGLIDRSVVQGKYILL